MCVLLRAAAHKCNNFKGSIYMVFDYMDHDMTGLMERKGYKFKPEQARRLARAVCNHAVLGLARRSTAVRLSPTQGLLGLQGEVVIRAGMESCHCS